MLFFIPIYLHNLRGDDYLVNRSKYNSTRGVIVTLIRSTNRSIALTINMIHSVVKFHKIDTLHSYPFVIFHDENFTSSMRQYILSCVLKNEQNIRILFARVNFTTKVRPDTGSHSGKSMEYRLMCRFWSYDVFYHSAIIEGHYDYLMIMDDDSYFTDIIKKDLLILSIDSN